MTGNDGLNMDLLLRLQRSGGCLGSIDGFFYGEWLNRFFPYLVVCFVPFCGCGVHTFVFRQFQ